MNICSIFKDKYYDFKEYHSSKDNLNFVKSKNIFQSLVIYQKLIEKLENQIIFQSKITKGKLCYQNTIFTLKLVEYFARQKKWSKLDLTLWLLFLADSSKPVEQISNFLKIPKKI